MLKLVIFTCLVVAISAQLDCTNLATGYYCNGQGYTLCVNGFGYQFACAAGTACACGQGNECDSPCTTACETGSSDAQNYCNIRLADFSGEQGYFCDADATGFYQCVRDAFCPTQASPQSQFIPCALGTECRCGNTFMECTSLLSVTPCVYPEDFIAFTTGTTTGTTGTTGSPVVPTQQSPHQNSLCGSFRWDCINFSQGPTAHLCADDSCGDVGDGGGCIWDIDTNAGSCAGDTFCAGIGLCDTASDCGNPNNWICAINTCCGAEGVCAPVCSE